MNLQRFPSQVIQHTTARHRARSGKSISRATQQQRAIPSSEDSKNEIIVKRLLRVGGGSHTSSIQH